MPAAKGSLARGGLLILTPRKLYSLTHEPNSPAAIPFSSSRRRGSGLCRHTVSSARPRLQPAHDSQSDDDSPGALFLWNSALSPAALSSESRHFPTPVLCDICATWTFDLYRTSRSVL